jgi:hypothetical protein
MCPSDRAINAFGVLKIARRAPFNSPILSTLLSYKIVKKITFIRVHSCNSWAFFPGA